MRKILEGLGVFAVFVLFLFFAGGVYVGTKYTDNKIGLDSLQHKVDSLHDENFVNSVELGRWEVTMDWYREENPKEAKKIEDWRSHNTE
jgi:hypothetical protein